MTGFACDVPEPRMLRVLCYNAKDGCPAVVSYMGTTPLKKLCPACMEFGTPTDKTGAPGNVEKATRALRHTPIPRGYGSCYSDEILVQITARPKSLAGGRVMPCQTEG
jgi:hypothetical protein